MKRRLRTRLAFTYLAVAVLAIVVAGVIVVLAGSRRLDGYLEQVRAARNAEVVGSLRSTYREPDGWDATAIFALSQVAASNHVDVAVYGTDGRLLFTVQGRGRDLDAGAAQPAGGLEGETGEPTGGGTSSPQAVAIDPSSFTIQSVPISVGGRTVGNAEVFSGAAARGAAEEAYARGLTRDLILAAAVAVVVAFLVGLLVSRRLSGPIEELADAAGDVSAGRLDVRVAPRGDDEVAALAAALNAMADRLARDEQWRRDMTSDLSHELRVPLATIRARVEALESGALPPTPDTLRGIGEEVERLGGLLASLRTLNELESEDLTVEHEPVDLAEVVAAAAAGRRPAFAAKGIALDVEAQRGMALGERGRLLQVTDGLLDNALKFTPAGGRVVVAVEAAEAGGAGPGLAGPAGPAVRLSVSDDGPGIDPVDLPFVFDRFYRARGARDTAGAGLGLAVCRAQVEAQGGSIVAGEAPGGGAQFTVLLPAAGEA